MKMNTKYKSVTTGLMTALVLGTSAIPLQASADVSSNIGIHSKYLLRGIFEENTGAAIQGGVDYTGKSGLYAGWWFSSLSYSYEATSDGKTNEKGFENDFYAGYNGEFTKGLGYSIGVIQYVYVNVENSDLLELTGKLTYGDFYVGFQRLLNDGWWGNAGDTYWKAGYAAKLPQDYGLAFDYGYYTYDKSDNSELGTATSIDSGFRHLNVTLSHPIAKTGANWYVQYTFAGKDRAGAEYNDSMVTGVTYSF